MSEFDQLQKLKAEQNAKQHLALFEHTQNGLLIWRAYLEYRKIGAPVPEAILKKLDSYANRLLSENMDLLDALDLRFNYKGGSGPRDDLRKKEHAGRVVEQVATYRQATGATLAEAFRHVAEKRNAIPGITTSPGAIKKLWYDWQKRKRIPLDD